MFELSSSKGQHTPRERVVRTSRGRKPTQCPGLGRLDIRSFCQCPLPPRGVPALGLVMGELAHLRKGSEGERCEPSVTVLSAP